MEKKKKNNANHGSYKIPSSFMILFEPAKRVG
jgi:hypothetical protein